MCGRSKETLSISKYGGGFICSTTSWLEVEMKATQRLLGSALIVNISRLNSNHSELQYTSY